MNAIRFANLFSIGTRERSRRGLMRALAGLAAGGGLIPAVTEKTIARKKRQKTRCGPCRRTKKGRCRGSKPNDSYCRDCGVCADGVCVPSQIGCPVCQECDGDGRCHALADETPCSPTAQCLSGACVPLPG